jgi:hypothetical protein
LALKKGTIYSAANTIANKRKFPIFSNWAQWHLASKMLTMLNQDEKCQNLISGWFSFSMYFHPKLEFWGVVIANNRCEVKD